MTISRKSRIAALAVALAIPAEGLRQMAYYDPVGILTVCYGTTGSEVVKGKKYSLDECRTMLDADMLASVETVERCHPGLPENVTAAFSDAVYNIGPTVACNSTASKLLEHGLIEDACRQLPRWDKASVAGVMVSLPGLTKRRNKEMELCLSAY